MNGNNQPVQILSIQEMAHNTNEDPIENNVCFKVSIKPCKGISVIGPWLVIEKWNKDEDENVNHQAQRKQNAIEYMHSRPTLKRCIDSVETMITWENADEYLHYGLYEDPLNEAALMSKHLNGKNEVELFYLDRIVNEYQLENIGHHKNY